jgi:protein phosphatase
MFDFGKAETVGKRSNQEDSCEFIMADIPSPDNTGVPAVVAALADGMGGHVGGQIASQTAIAGFKNHCVRSGRVPTSECLHESLMAANEALAETRRRNTALEGMGSTFIAATFENASLRWISVGDSILYLYRNGELTRLNADHSMAPELDRMAARNEITPEQARRNPMRHALRSALMGDALELIDQPVEPFPLLHGDWVLIASDGLETLNGTAIKGCIGQAAEGGAQAVAEQLIVAVNAAGDPAQDNTTVMTIHAILSGEVDNAQ